MSADPAALDAELVIARIGTIATEATTCMPRRPGSASQAVALRFGCRCTAP
jgi:hypothetical protein